MIIFEKHYGLESFIEASICQSNTNRTINLSNFSITDKDLKRIVLVLIKTKYTFSLNLQQFTGVSSNGFCLFAGSLATNNVGRLLTSLNLSNCQSIDDESCRAIGRSFKRLNVINLNWCKVTRAGIEFILKGCRYIEELRIRNIKLGDKGMEELRMYALMTKTLKVLGMCVCE